MRLDTTLFTVGVLFSTALADIKTIKTSMKDVAVKAKELSNAIVKWPGDASSGGDMLCKTVALRKSFDACTKTFQTSKPLKMGEVSHLPLMRMGVAMFDLVERTVKARPKFDRVGATASIFEMIKAQQVPASKAMKAILDKLPPDFKNTKLPFFNQNYNDLAQTLMKQQFDDLLKELQPRPEQVSPLTPFVVMAAQVSQSIDTAPFCRSVPKVMNTLAGQKTTSLGNLTKQVLDVLDSSGVQDVVPLDIIKKNAEVFGVPPDTIPNVLKAFGASEKGLPLRAFTQQVPGLLKQFNLNNIVLNPSKITSFANLFIETMLGSAPR